EAEEYLRSLGVNSIFNPARHDAEELGLGTHPDENMKITDVMVHEWMRTDLAEVAQSQMILLLPGWEQSTGARREAQVAVWCGLSAWEYDPTAPEGQRLRPINLA